MKTAEEILKEHLNTEALTESQYDAILEAMQEYADKRIEELLNTAL